MPRQPESRSNDKKQYIPGAQRLNGFSVEPEKLIVITDKKHPLYDPRVELPLDDKMVLNIMAYGVRQAVNVTKMNGDVIVVDGRRRVMHAVEANKRLVKEGKEPIRVPVIGEKGQTEADLFGVTCFMNEHRRDDSVLTKAEKASKLLQMGKSEHEVCVVFGITKQTLSNWLKLFELDPKVRKAVDDGVIAPSAAAPLAALSRKEQVEKLGELLADAPTTGKRAGKVSARKAKAAAREQRGGIVPPTKREMAMVYEVLKDERDTGEDPVGTANALGWVLGLISADDAGLDLDAIRKRAEASKADQNAKAG